jgi:glycerophosphoryl diester phosphodiesterase
MAPRLAGGFDLQGHRGARGLAPENTLAGFRKALEIGVPTLELDLAMTRDGVLVVSHDPVLNPDVYRTVSAENVREAGALGLGGPSTSGPTFSG